MCVLCGAVLRWLVCLFVCLFVWLEMLLSSNTDSIWRDVCSLFWNLTLLTDFLQVVVFSLVFYDQ